MIFENENSKIEIVVSGYTENTCFMEEVRKNILDCIIPYFMDERHGTLFSSLFMTVDIIILHDKISELLEGKVDFAEHKSEWDAFAFRAIRQGEKYEVYVYIDDFPVGCLEDSFILSVEELEKIKDELGQYMIDYPVVK